MKPPAIEAITAEDAAAAKAETQEVLSATTNQDE
jgi:hypothetical protein